MQASKRRQGKECRLTCMQLKYFARETSTLAPIQVVGRAILIYRSIIYFCAPRRRLRIGCARGEWQERSTSLISPTHGNWGKKRLRMQLISSTGDTAHAPPTQEKFSAPPHPLSWAAQT